MLRDLDAVGPQLFHDDRREGVLNEPLRHLAARRDEAAGLEHIGPQRQYRLRPGKPLRLAELLLFYDQRDYPHSRELRALFHARVRVPRRYHQLILLVERVQFSYVNPKQPVAVGDELDLALLHRGRVHIFTLAEGAQALRGVVLVHHALVLLPDVDMLLAHREQHRHVLLRDDMALPEARVLCHAYDYLSHVMAEHMSHRVLHRDKFHRSSPPNSFFTNITHRPPNCNQKQFVFQLQSLRFVI